MEKPRTARFLHQLLVLYQRVALYKSNLALDVESARDVNVSLAEAFEQRKPLAVFQTATSCLPWRSTSSHEAASLQA